MTFHPDFNNNGLVYTNSTNLLRGDLVTAQYRGSAANPTKADANSVLFVSTRPKPFPKVARGRRGLGWRTQPPPRIVNRPVTADEPLGYPVRKGRL